MAKGKATPKQRGSKDQLNFSDATVQLFHPAHDGDFAVSFLILSVGDERVAFNCGEGFQRMCAECKACSNTGTPRRPPGRMRSAAIACECVRA